MPRNKKKMNAPRRQVSARDWESDEVLSLPTASRMRRRTTDEQSVKPQPVTRRRARDRRITVRSELRSEPDLRKFARAAIALALAAAEREAQTSADGNQPIPETNSEIADE